MKKTSLLVLLTILSTMSLASEGHEQSATETIHPEQEILNEVCPVMVGNEINPELYSTYEGKRVNFCCPSCKEAFDKNPKEYLDRLPQFASEPEHSGHENSQTPSFSYFKLVKPMGIVTLTMIILTVSAGLLRRKKPKFLLKWHKRLGVLTLITALIHATLVLLTH